MAKDTVVANNENMNKLAGQKAHEQHEIDVAVAKAQEIAEKSYLEVLNYLKVGVSEKEISEKSPALCHCVADSFLAGILRPESAAHRYAGRCFSLYFCTDLSPARRSHAADLLVLHAGEESRQISHSCRHCQSAAGCFLEVCRNDPHRG